MLTRLNPHRGPVHPRLLRRPTAPLGPRAMDGATRAVRLKWEHDAERAGLPRPRLAAWWHWLARQRGEGAWR